MSGQTVCFSVTGEFVTRHARELTLEGAWREAIEFLTLGIDGLDTDTALSVIKGDKRFTGTNTIALEDDFESGEYIRDIKAKYAGILKAGRAYCQPYAYVSCYGEQDVQNVYKTLRPIDPFDQEDKEQIARQRSLYYADDQESDESFVLRIGRREYSVLFRKVEKPLWGDHFSDPQKALDDFVDKNGMLGLSERGTPTETSCDSLQSMRNTGAPVDDKEECGASPVPVSVDMDTGMKKDLEQELREEVVRRANSQEDGWLLLDLEYQVNGEAVTEQLAVPRTPFVRWAIRTASLNVEPPEWDNVSPPEFKMPGDSIDHTDWLLGAGIDLDEWADKLESPRLNALDRAAWDKFYEIQEEYMTVNAARLYGSGSYTGTVVHAGIDQEYEQDNPVLVLPHGGVEYYNTMVFTARRNGGRVAVIVERGGENCHLVTNAREKDIMILMVPGAREKLRQGERVMVDADFAIIKKNK